MTNGGWLRMLAVCICAISAPGLSRAQSVPTFSLVDSDITIDSGATEGRASMVLKADNLDAARLTKPIENIADMNTPLPPAVEVGFAARELDRRDASRRWVLTADIKGVPRNVTQKRYLSFRFDGRDFTLPYTLTNKSTATFAWSIKGLPTELSLGEGQSIEVGIAVQAVGATKVRVLQSSLVEQSSKMPLDGGLVLCAQTTDLCTDAGIDLTPNSSNRLWLRLQPENAGAMVGKYVGTVSIGAAEKPEGDTLNLTIYRTTKLRQAFGAIAILVGVVCAWLTTSLSQSRLNRAQALLPASLLADRVRALQQRLVNAPPSTDESSISNTRDALEGLLQALSERQLDANNYLPRSMPSPFRGLEPDINGYKQALAQAGAKVALLSLLIDRGFASLWKKIPALPNDASRKAIQDASRALDQKANEEPPPSIQDIIPFIQKTLDDLDKALKGVAAEMAPSSFQPVSIQPPSFEQLTTEIRNLSGITWLVFGGLAWAVGCYILIIGNLGFGVVADYFTCLFWGFGLPVSGQQLVQSTVGSVGTALGVTVPKA